jgi:hypothetical protein
MQRKLLGCAAVAVALLAAGDRPALAPRAAPLERLRDAIAAREYEASENRQGLLQAPNRAQGLRTYFEPAGIRVVDRTAPGGAELAQLTLHGVGRPGALSAAEPGEVSHRGARVEIARPGLVEWYENAPAGLEQGFTLAEPPAGGAGKLVLELAIASSEVTVETDDSLVLRAPSGRRLRYADLRAADASGRGLASRFELAGASVVRLVVDDAGARYPVQIDPLLTEVADATVTGGADDQIGISVANAGDTNGDGYDDVIVGARSFDASLSLDGAAFIFLGGPDGVASGPATVTAWTLLRPEQTDAAFGVSVASAGDVNGDGYADVIVGARQYQVALDQEGAAFIFLGGPSGIRDGTPAFADTVLRGGQAEAYFGAVVASAGDVNGDGYADVIIGSSYKTGSLQGAAFIFLGGPSGVASGTAAAAATVLLPDASIPLGGFAGSVASAGDVDGDGYDDVLVGADFADAAYIFRGGASGVASASSAAAATVLTGTAGTDFGLRVASAGDVNGDGYADVIVGAPFAGGGTASVFLGGPAGVPDGTAATAPGQLTCTQAMGGFGAAVASAGDVNGDGFGDVVVVSAPNVGASTAFVYYGGSAGIASGDEHSSAAQLTLAQTGSLSVSCAAADVNGDGFADVIAGAPFASPASVPDGGAVSVYLGGPTGLTGTSFATANGNVQANQASAQLGTSVASAGDVNGDGYSDLIVGAPFYDSGETDEGAAFVFLGGPTGVAAGTPASASATLQSNQANAQLGTSVAAAGDVNGDGYADVIVGAPLYDDGQTDEGAAFVFLGGPAGVASQSAAAAYARFESDQASAHLGASVADAGDVNGDGRSDVIVGAPLYDAGQTDEGAAFVFVAGASGLASGTPATAQATLQSDQANAHLGASVAAAGDVNGDGYADVIVGAPQYSDGAAASGRALLVRGSATGIDPNAVTILRIAVPSGQHGGNSVAGAGDVNGDGFDDVIVGEKGAAGLFYGSASPPASLTTFPTVLSSSAGDADFGHVVAGVGDVDGDGFADVMVGSGTGTGAVWLFRGRASGIASGSDTTAALALAGDQSGALFGTSLASAGDVNGDGFPDVVVGAPAYDATETDEGVAFLFYGGRRSGRPVLARERRGDGSGVLVQPWGDARRGDAFVAQIAGALPGGRGRAKLQAEACPQLVAFGSADCATATASVWTPVTPASPAPPLSVTVTGLPPNALLHWRARVLHAGTVGAPPPSPAHGPWRSLPIPFANEAIRTSPDADLDGVPDSIDNCRFRANPGQGDAGGFGASSGPDGIGDACQCGNVSGDGRVSPADVATYRQFLANPTGAPLSADAQARCVVLDTGTACNIVQVSAIRRGLNAPPLAPLTTSAAAQVCAATKP